MTHDEMFNNLFLVEIYTNGDLGLDLNIGVLGATVSIRYPKSSIGL